MTAVEKLIKSIEDKFDRFYENEFLHMRKKVDWVFIFMLTSAITFIGTLIVAILTLVKAIKLF